MKGQSLVEFALSIVVLLFLLSGVVEFGIAFFQYVQLRDAAQEGALYGSVCDCPVAEIEERVRASSTTPINLETAPIFIEVSAVDPYGNPKDAELACEEDALSVRVSFAHKIFMPFLPQLIGRDEIILSAVVIDTVLVPKC